MNVAMVPTPLPIRCRCGLANMTQHVLLGYILCAYEQKGKLHFLENDIRIVLFLSMCLSVLFVVCRPICCRCVFRCATGCGCKSWKCKIKCLGISPRNVRQCIDCCRLGEYHRPNKSDNQQMQLDFDFGNVCQIENETYHPDINSVR